VRENMNKKAAYLVIYEFLYRFLIGLTVTWIFFNLRKIKSDQFKFYFLIVLFFCSFSNIIKSIPSGGRFVVLSNLMVCFALLWFLSKSIGGFIPRYSKVFLSGILLFIIVVQVRFGLDFIGVMFFIGNPVINLFVESNVPILDLIKSTF
ncbi:MAG: hypothetical protein ACKO7P_14340, partial [Bacteroidota bacterium]